MKVHIVVLMGMVLLAISSPVPAADLSGQSSTYLQSREAYDSSKLLPLFEYLDFKAEDIGSKAVSFHFGGWARWDLRDDSTPGKDKNSDLQYAYLNLRGGPGNSMLRLGRVQVNEGVASEQLDGLYGRTSLLGGFGVAAFTGVPVETNFDGRSGDSIMGGRISQSIPDLYRAGISYLKEKNGAAVDNGKETSKDFREEEGLDLWLRPLAELELTGTSFYNAVTNDWMLHSYNLVIGPFTGLRLTGQGMKVNYADYFTAKTTSVFRFDPAVIDRNETMTSFSEELSWTGEGFTVAGNYRTYAYTVSGDATSYGGRLGWSGGKTGAAGISYQRMDGATAALRYDQYQVYGRAAAGPVDLSASWLVVQYDKAVSGVKNAYAATLAAGYDLDALTKISADVEYGRNPYYDRDVRTLFKLIRAFDTGNERKSK